MVAYPNFYENLAEASMRLRNTVVLYDGLPYFVLAVTNHVSDGLFRIYIEPLKDSTSLMSTLSSYRAPSDELHSNSEKLGPLMDKWMAEHGEKFGVLRKKMNSPSFNRFRPFPLGMCNTPYKVLYIERNPNRKSEQGLINSMMFQYEISLNPKIYLSRDGISIFSEYFKDCIIGGHPSIFECLDSLKNPLIENQALAFHRDFALIKGPLNTFFLAYKTDIVGILPNKDLSLLQIGESFRYTREVIESLGIFSQIQD